MEYRFECGQHPQVLNGAPVIVLSFSALMFKINSFLMVFFSKCLGVITIQPRHLFALALSLTAHLFLVCLFGIDAGPIYGLEPSAEKSVRTLSVSLLKQDVATHMPGTKLAGYGKEKEKEKEELQVLPTAPARAAVVAPNQDSSIFTIVAQPEPYYFRANELTEKPRVLLDISPDLSLSLPNGLSQLAVLRLLINERGDIDQVVIEDSALPEEAQHLVLDAFARTKFQPGKIGDIPVKSELRIEVMLENMAP
jgi:hypothetical protein